METVRGAVAHGRTWAYADRHARAIDGAASTTTTTTRGFETGGGAARRFRRCCAGAADVGSNATALETLAALFEARGDVAGVQVLEEGGIARIVSRAV